ncbi:DUF4160 domain-containing protein [Shivajiella indica]|uniref:DUF4160 domain-containing protein n=1 Tax=Shivajiella indica TaxID=872115 RepID=A0ABW5B6X9_9BACT
MDRDKQRLKAALLKNHNRKHSTHSCSAKFGIWLKGLKKNSYHKRGPASGEAGQRGGFKRSCKFWLEPDIELVENKKGEFTEKELNEIKKLIKIHQKTLLDQLSLFYENKEVKAIRL